MTQTRQLRLAQTHCSGLPPWEVPIVPPLDVPGRQVPLTWHHEVNHSTVVPGKALGPAQLWLIHHRHQVPLATPRQVPHLPLLLLIPANALPALCKDILGEADEPLSLLQQLQFQQVAAASHAVLAFLHIHDTLQLEPPAGDTAGVGTSPKHQPLSLPPPACSVLPGSFLLANTNLFVPSFPLALLHHFQNPLGRFSTCFLNPQACGIRSGIPAKRK